MTETTGAFRAVNALCVFNCLGFHSYSILVKPQTESTIKLQRSKMEDRNQDYSYFFMGETCLESVSVDYFNLRPVEEENDEGNSCPGDSSESNQDNIIDIA